MNDVTALPVPDVGRDAAERFVADHLGGLTDDRGGSPRFQGGQSAADAALAAYDVVGYAATRNQVLPESRRGASALSPYIRHGLLPLQRVWDHVAGGPSRDVRKFRDELLWQEYARHWYARLGRRTGRALRAELPATGDPGDAWRSDMACTAFVVDELLRDGWIVNQTRMWMASDWSVRHDVDWRVGEDRFFRHLLDGSRAANRLGWQWTTGVGAGKPYSFSRWQVEKRAPELCDRCPLSESCPIQGWPDAPPRTKVGRPDAERNASFDDMSGPADVVTTGEPDTAWVTAESLGDEDPALAAHPDLPAVFVFDQPLLARLRLSAKRLVFLVETLAELAGSRDLELRLGDPGEVLAGRSLAVTHAPVPGFARLSTRIAPAVTHPWPWLVPPIDGSVASFSQWRRQITTPT